MTIQDSARLDSLFEALQKSEFRQKFRLGRQDFLALKSGGVPVALRHAAAFIEERLAPATVDLTGGMAHTSTEGNLLHCSSR